MDFSYLRDFVASLTDDLVIELVRKIRETASTNRLHRSRAFWTRQEKKQRKEVKRLDKHAHNSEVEFSPSILPHEQREGKAKKPSFIFKEERIRTGMNHYLDCEMVV